MTQTSSTHQLSGLRLLVVEDTFLVADLIVEQLLECGCEVVGPAARLPKALALAEQEALDGALLDVNLAGEYSFPVASALAARGVPFIFLTGYGQSVIPEAFRAAPRLAKPFDMDDLVRGLTMAFAPRASPSTTLVV